MTQEKYFWYTATTKCETCKSLNLERFLRSGIHVPKNPKGYRGQWFCETCKSTTFQVVTKVTDTDERFIKRELRKILN